MLVPFHLTYQHQAVVFKLFCCCCLFCCCFFTNIVKKLNTPQNHTTANTSATTRHNTANATDQLTSSCFKYTNKTKGHTTIKYIKAHYQEHTKTASLQLLFGGSNVGWLDGQAAAYPVNTPDPICIQSSARKHWPEVGRMSLAHWLAFGPDPFSPNLTQSARTK